MEFYTQQDLQDNGAQMRRVFWTIGIPTLAMLAALAVSLVLRAEWLTILITVVWGAVLIFLWDMKIAPVLSYRRHLNAVLGGLRRNAEGTVVSFSEDNAFKDGVSFWTLLINTDPKMDPKGERLFYVDCCKQRPALEQGDAVRITSNGNYVTAWEK